MKLFQITLVMTSAIFLFMGAAYAEAIYNEDGTAPVVHWAIMDSEHGKMQEIMSMGGKFVGPETAKESGTYALYGATGAKNSDRTIILEIYASETAYERHVGSEAFKNYREARKNVLKNLDLIPMQPIVLEQKTGGTGTVAVMRRIVVKPAQTAHYKALATLEAERAVREDNGVLGVFVTAEFEQTNILHTLSIYRDEAAKSVYEKSQGCEEFAAQTRDFVLTSSEIENLPANIVLSQKGLHL